MSADYRDAVVIVDFAPERLEFLGWLERLGWLEWLVIVEKFFGRIISKATDDL